MKITITHDQDSIDPGATVPDEDFPAVIDSLESAYEAAILKEFPDAEVGFVRGNDPRSVRVDGTGMDDPEDTEDEINRICSLVYETGLFW